jgi:hypothetical protein
MLVLQGFPPGMVVLRGAWIGMPGSQVERRVSVAVHETQRQQHNQAPDDQQPHKYKTRAVEKSATVFT